MPALYAAFLSVVNCIVALFDSHTQRLAMQTIDFGSMSIDELLAVREEITRTLPAKVNAEKRKQQNHWTSPNLKLRVLLGCVAQIARFIPGLAISIRRTGSGRVGASSRTNSANCSPTRPRWMMSGSFGMADGRKMSSGGLTEERIIWRTRFQAQIFDFRGQAVLTRFDCCEFVKCTLLIDHGTEQLAFTECAFKDCNVDRLRSDEERGLYVRNNVFHRPLEERRAEFENKLAQILTTRRNKLPSPHIWL
jgi:hypothetical protein